MATPGCGAVVSAAAHDLLQHIPASAGTHNFFQPSHVQGILPSLSVDTDSMLYDRGVGYQFTTEPWVVAMPWTAGSPAATGYGVEDDTSSDLYGGRNLYSLSQGLPVTNNSGKADGHYEHGVWSESWLPSSVQKSANVTVCLDAPEFSGWK